MLKVITFKPGNSCKCTFFKALCFFISQIICSRPFLRRYCIYVRKTLVVIYCVLTTYLTTRPISEVLLFLRSTYLASIHFERYRNYFRRQFVVKDEVFSRILCFFEMNISHSFFERYWVIISCSYLFVEASFLVLVIHSLKFIVFFVVFFSEQRLIKSKDNVRQKVNITYAMNKKKKSNMK